MDERSFFEGVASYRLMAKKEVGQNFLIDPKVASAIVDSLEIQPGERVVEIGCGPGSLTYFLAQSEGQIEAIDIDEAMILKTGEDFASCSNVEVKYGNAAKWDYAPYDKIIGNLPYYITSSLIERAILKGDHASKMVFMVQKEAGERITALPKTKDYSPLAILIALTFSVTRIRVVGRNAFVPPPHVESAVYVFSRKEDISLKEAEKVYHLATTCFLQRRKTLYNNLKNLLPNEEACRNAIASLNLPLTVRPEELSPDQYRRLAQML